ncbi:MAG: hypothetical protein ACLGIF_05375 [Actinomycetes bacterium]
MIWLEVDPNLVRPGWMPLLIILLLGVVMVFLYLSMRKQFRKINLPDEDRAGEDHPAPRPRS